MKRLSVGKKVLIGLGVVIIVLAITNPSQKEFADFTVDNMRHELHTQKRTQNWIIFSIYEDDYGYRTYKYFAIFKNFFSIGN